MGQLYCYSYNFERQEGNHTRVTSCLHGGYLAQQRRQGRRVAPKPDDTNIMEIRPNRFLHIKRLNPKERDEKFEKEMVSYLQFRENGLLLNTFPSFRGNAKSRGSNTDGKLPQVHATNQDISKTNSIKGETVDVVANNIDTVNSDEPSKGIWITEALKSESGTKIGLSPSRASTNSQGIHSVSNVQVSVNRPTSMNGTELGKIGESSETSSDIHKFRKDSISTDKHLKSPRKTKDHRPVSGRSFRKSVVSRTLSHDSESQCDTEFDANLHLQSPYKDVTIFFIHGVGGCADVWKAQMQYFADLGIEVIAPDLIGHGFSFSPDSSRAYHFTEILADMEAIFDKYCKKQNVIIGHSYGCAFAAALGRQRARRVTKLVLVSGGAPIPLAPQPGVFRLPVCMLSCIKPCLFRRFERNAFHGNVKDSGVSKELAFDVPVYVLSHMMNGQDWLDGDELYHQWLTMPTLLLHGQYDRFVTVEEEMEMEKAIYRSTLKVVDNSSHMVMMEAPDQVNQIVYTFIFQSHHPETGRSTAMGTSKSMTSVRAKSARIKSSKQLA